MAFTERHEHKIEIIPRTTSCNAVVRTLLKRMVSKWDALITATSKHLVMI
jgi:hypothetical protein